MGKWALENKKEQSIPHVFLAALGVVGLGTLLLFFALNVSSAPTPPFTAYTQFGHQAGDTGPGDFQGTSADVYSFPGFLLVRNALGVGSSFTAASMTGDIQLEKNEAGAQTILEVQNSSTAGNSDALTTIITSSATGRALLSLTTPLQTWALATDNTGSLKIGNSGFGDQLIMNTAGDTTVLGAVSATGDVCTTLNGGTCLSEANDDIGAPTAGIRVVCSGGTCANASLGAVVGALEAGCPSGTIPLSCSGVVDAGAGQTLRKLGYRSLFGNYGDDGASTSLPGNPPGCRMEWQTTGGTPQGYVVAYCAPIGT